MNPLTLCPAEFCRVTHACEEGGEFAVEYTTMAEVWDNCPRPDWLLWIADKIGQRPDDQTMRLFAIWCARSTPLGDARTTGDLLTDPRSLAALEVAERYAHGQATAEELDAARDAAADAAWAASQEAARDAAAVAAQSAARVAARDAAWAAAADAAWAAARVAARDAAWAAAADAAAWAAARVAAWAASQEAAWAAAADAAAVAARAASRNAQADQFRHMVPNPFRVKEGQP